MPNKYYTLYVYQTKEDYKINKYCNKIVAYSSYAIEKDGIKEVTSKHAYIGIVKDWNMRNVILITEDGVALHWVIPSMSVTVASRIDLAIKSKGIEYNSDSVSIIKAGKDGEAHLYVDGVDMGGFYEDALDWLNSAIATAMEVADNKLIEEFVFKGALEPKGILMYSNSSKSKNCVVYMWNLGLQECSKYV